MNDNLLELLKVEKIKAFKAKDTIKKDCINNVINSILYETKKNKANLLYEDEIRLLKKEISQQKETLESELQANRLESSVNTKNKIDILESYLPKQLTDSELEDIINSTIKQSEIILTNQKQFGKLIPEILKKVGTKSDGSKINLILSKIINKI